MSIKTKKILTKISIALGVLLVAIAIVLICCYTCIKTNTVTIEIGKHLYDWDEEKFALGMAQQKANGICLAQDGATNFKIYLKDEYRAELEADAEYLQRVLRQMITGKDMNAVGEGDGFEIVSEPTTGSMIVLNDLPGEDDNALLEDVNDDGYMLMYEGQNIYICGQKRSIEYKEIDKIVENDGTAGTANGIYCFLENDLGCMFVREDPKYDYIPHLPTIWLDREGGRIDNPDFSWRRVYQYEVQGYLKEDGVETTEDWMWNRRLKSNGTGEYIFDSDGMGLNDGNAQWGTWCHTIYLFVPPEKYFTEHPEYYSLVAGKRRYEYNGLQCQLCLSNPDIVDIIEKGMRERMEQFPDAIYWDFSMNDSRLPCECAECTAKYFKYGSHAGAMIEVINELASRMPDKRISTLAYFYNRKAPKGITLKDNVSVTIAPLCSSQLHSSKYGYINSAQAKQMVEEWSKITKHITLWDYTVNFRHLLAPFPNYAVQRENLEFYKEHGVDMVFHQGSREKNDEQARLRSYVLARQLWDIDVDINKLMGKYLQVTYKDAAPKIAEYLDIMSAAVEKAWELEIYDDVYSHERDYLSREYLKRYSDILNDAYALAPDEDTKYFVEEFQINVDYAIMMADSTTEKEQKAAFERFKRMVGKGEGQHDISRTNEVGGVTEINAFINSTYPQRLATRRAALTVMCVGLALSVLACGIAVAAIKSAKGVYLRRKRKG